MLPERINPCDYQKLRERRKSLEFPGFIGLMFPILGDEPAHRHWRKSAPTMAPTKAEIDLPKRNSALCEPLGHRYARTFIVSE